VTLADFDKEYVNIDDDDEDDNDRVRKGGRGAGGHHRGGKGRGGRSSRLGGAVDWTGEVTKLLLKSSKWKLALVGLVLGLLCAVTHQSYLWIKSERSSSGNGFIYRISLDLSIYKLYSLISCVYVCVCVYSL
jgi:hypothetical protein